jgi:hypothetical protein
MGTPDHGKKRFSVMEDAPATAADTGIKILE